MSRVVRFTILVVAAVVLMFLARNKVGSAIGIQSAPQQSQPIELQSLPAQAQASAVPSQAASQLAAADGLVWNDLNHDGLQQYGEPGLPNVTMNILTAAKVVAGTTVTDANGAYRFQNLTPGDYFVNILQPAGFVISPMDQGQNDLVDSDSDTVTAESPVTTLLPGENGIVWTTGVYSPTAAVQASPGTVQPPPAEITVCAPGTYSVGGVSTLLVNQLDANYCLHAFLFKSGFAIGLIPQGAGSILSAVTFVEIYNQNQLVYQYNVSGQTNSIQVCYAVPVGKQGQIYFLDHYGPRFGSHPGKPAWQPLPTTIQNGVACAVAQTTGAYALIGK
jgi:hypothetical protein